MKRLILGCFFLLVTFSFALEGGPKVPSPLVVAHRGASGYLPEHTLASYELAIEQGAHYIEQDLVPTRDGHLICRHENDLTQTTDVADHPEFRQRKVTKEIDGRKVTGWFSEDFTLAEIKILRARGRNRESSRFDGQYLIPTFDEALELARRSSQDRETPVGLYPELKHPSYFRALGLPLEERLLERLEQAGYNRADAPVIIQCFEVSSLRKLNALTPLPLAQLLSYQGSPQDQIEMETGLTYASMASPEGLAQIATYAEIVAPSKYQIFPPGPDWSLPTEATRLIEDAHGCGLQVHAYTFRAENSTLPPGFRRGEDSDNGDLAGEVAVYRKAGLDGFFANHPDLALEGLEVRPR